MKWFRLGLPAVVLLVLMAGSSAVSAAQSSAMCVGTWHVSFAPGLGTTSHGADFSTRPTMIQCFGAVKGSPVSGSGTLAQKGHLEGTVLGGTGSGTTTLTIPTPAGTRTVTFDDTLTYGPGIGFKTSSSLLGTFTFGFFPVSGDGVTTPVTEIAVVGQFSLTS
jgi:hypothetical protein